MKHCLIAIESLGMKPGSAILTIAAAVFALDRHTARQPELGFHANITPKSCEQVGLVLDPETVKWWKKQPEERIAKLTKDRITIDHALSNFADFLKHWQPEFFWGYGTTFEPALIAEAFRRCQLDIPWKFYNTRDIRTALHVLNYDTRDTKIETIADNLLDEAWHRVRWLQNALRLHATPTTGIFE